MTPSMRLDETALSISACSRSTLSFCGDCRVNSSCLPRASVRPARVQTTVVGIDEGRRENCPRVIIRLISLIRATSWSAVILKSSPRLFHRNGQTEERRGGRIAEHVPGRTGLPGRG